jgi:hypothetical protein
MALTADQKTYTNAKDTAYAQIKAATEAQDSVAYQKAYSDYTQASKNLDVSNVSAAAASGTQSPTATNASDVTSAATVASAPVAGDTSVGSYVSSAADWFNQKTNSALNYFGIRSVAGVPDGAQPRQTQGAIANVKKINQTEIDQDLRVRVLVPAKYQLLPNTSGLSKELSSIGGIIFPYTPSISYEHSAEYTSANPTHSNFSIYFYKNSKVSPINITGKFTVQNEQDAGVYLATVHLLRALTKMHSGGRTGDKESGAPPPICQLMAYGNYMLDKTPVVISSFRIELPDSVDYFKLGKLSGSNAETVYGISSVPVVSTIAITCIPMYSRNEMQQFSVNGWLAGNSNRKQGYL